MWKSSPASESSVVMQSVCGCTLTETSARLEHMGWRVSKPSQISKGISVVTAVSKQRHMILYAKHGRVWTVNFGRPGDGTMRFKQVSSKDASEPKLPAEPTPVIEIPPARKPRKS